MIALWEDYVMLSIIPLWLLLPIRKLRFKTKTLFYLFSMLPKSCIAPGTSIALPRYIIWFISTNPMNSFLFQFSITDSRSANKAPYHFSFVCSLVWLPDVFLVTSAANSDDSWITRAFSFQMTSRRWLDQRSSGWVSDLEQERYPFSTRSSNLSTIERWCDT